MVDVSAHAVRTYLGLRIFWSSFVVRDRCDVVDCMTGPSDSVNDYDCVLRILGVGIVIGRWCEV